MANKFYEENNPELHNKNNSKIQPNFIRIKWTTKLTNEVQKHFMQKQTSIKIWGNKKYKKCA